MRPSGHREIRVGEASLPVAPVNGGVRHIHIQEVGRHPDDRDARELLRGLERRLDSRADRLPVGLQHRNPGYLAVVAGVLHDV